MATKRLARMRRMSTTIELNDIAHTPTAAGSFRFGIRPSSVPLDSLMITPEQDVPVVRSGRRYLQTSKSADINLEERQNTTDRTPTGNALSSNSMENSLLLLNNNNVNFNTSTSLATTASSANQIIYVPPIDAVKNLSNERKYVDTLKKAVSGLVLIVVVSASCAGGTQFSRKALTDQNFYAPYFLAWFCANWIIICFPLYAMFSFFLRCLKKSNVRKSSRDIFRDAKSIYGHPVTTNSVVQKSLFFMILWVVVNYTYFQALGYLSPAETHALFVSHPAFIYLISWIYFHDAFVPTRIISVLLSIIGVVLMAHATGIGATNFLGVVTGVIAASLASIFKIVFKSIFGDATLNQISLFFTMIGVSNLIFNWPVAFILYVTNAEKIEWLAAPWKYICLSAALSLIWQFLTNLSSKSKKATFISIGLLISLPLNAVVDFLLRNAIMGTFQIIGSVCILLSCLLLLLPPDITSRIPNSFLKADDL